MLSVYIISNTAYVRASARINFAIKCNLVELFQSDAVFIVHSTLYYFWFKAVKRLKVGYERSPNRSSFGGARRKVTIGIRDADVQSISVG